MSLYKLDNWVPDNNRYLETGIDNIVITLKNAIS